MQINEPKKRDEHHYIEISYAEKKGIRLWQAKTRQVQQLQRRVRLHFL